MRTAEALQAEARQLAQAFRWEEAIAKYAEALTVQPSFALALNGRGFAYLQQRQTAKAIEDFDAAIRIRPDYANAYRNRAAARRIAGDAAGAQKDAAMAEELQGRR
jgi:tetratricopeptide (TPR) repeat protein